MRRFLSRFAIPLLTLVMAGAPGLAFGQGAWFVVADPAYNCNIVNHPAGRWEQQIGGPFATIAEANTAMFRATVACRVRSPSPRAIGRFSLR
jgi:hypothetical protein